MKQLLIGILFNEVVGGLGPSRITSYLQEQGQVVHAVDYREIVPLSEEGVEDFFSLDPAEQKRLRRTFKERAVTQIQHLDAVILTGNPQAVDPRFYGAERIGPPHKYDLHRTLAEYAIFEHALERGMPALGLCGGFQAANVYLGGTLRKFTPEQLAVHGCFVSHSIVLDATSELGQIMCPRSSADDLRVSCWCNHKWVIDHLGGQNRINETEPFLKSVAYADDAGHTIEMAESTYGAPLYLTLYHPEALWVYWDELVPTPEALQANENIFKALVGAAQTFHLKKDLSNTIRTVNSETVTLLLQAASRSG